MTVSVIIPCYYAAKTIENVVREIKSEFSRHEEYSCQLILVNDGSTDETFSIIQRLCCEDDTIIGVDLTRNYGQESARFAGIHYATGDCAIYMDDDGQHRPADIFQLIEKLQEGYDVVFADIQNRKDSIFKRITSKLHGKIAEWIGNSPKGIHLSSFIACSSTMIGIAKKYHSPFPSIGAFFTCVTTRFANVPVEYKKRSEGSSNYNLRRLIALWLRAFTNFSIVPLRFATFFGCLFAGGGLLFTLYNVIKKLLNPDVLAGFTSVISSIYLVGGMILILLGLIGEYIGRMYMTVSNKPQYVVRNVAGGNFTAEQHREIFEREQYQ